MEELVSICLILIGLFPLIMFALLLGTAILGMLIECAKSIFEEIKR